MSENTNPNPTSNNDSTPSDAFTDQFPIVDPKNLDPKRKPATPAANIYDRAGRVAPEEIAPYKPSPSEQDTTVMPAAQQDLPTGLFGNKPAPTSDDYAEDTQFFPSPQTQEAQQAEADNPFYDDSVDFATTELPRDDNYAPSSYNDEDYASPDPGYDDSNDRYDPQPETSYEEAQSPVVAAPAIARDREVVNEEFLNAKTQDEPKEKRGTLDFGLLLVRAIIAGYLITIAVSTFFQLGANPGITGLQQEFSTYTFGSALAIAIPTMQLAAGVFLLCGLLSPVVTALSIIVCGFSTLHAIDKQPDFSVFNPNDSVWLSLILTALAFALVFAGPGTISFDKSRGWARRPLASSWIFAIVGLLGAAAVWWFGTGANPFS